MHIPDGFLDLKTCGVFWGLGAAGMAAAVAKCRANLEDRTVPLMGVMSAFLFAAQMVNFPVGAGTSGHLLGGMLAAAVLGPWAAMLVVGLVLVAQCLLFQDGGLTALGANIFNMSIVGVWVGYGIFKLFKLFSPGRARDLVGIFVGSWFSVMVAAGFCALELAWSGTFALKPALIAMLGIHSIIGIGEGLITASILSFVLATRPEIVTSLGDHPLRTG
ncbi:MAG: energy-coupling factor ABC transporter permease [bacterium]